MDSRRHKIQKLLNDHNIQGAIVSSPENFHYVTGFSSHQHTVSRNPIFSGAVITQDVGIPAKVFAMDFEIPALMEKNKDVDFRPYDTWVGVKKWEEINENRLANTKEHMKSWLDVLKKIVVDLSLQDQRIGLELGFINVEFYKILVDAFPNVTFVDISNLFILARSVKTKEEIEHIRNLTRVADEALMAASKLVEVGHREREVAQVFREYVTKSGFCLPSSWSTFNTGKNSSRLCLPTDTVIEEGDVFKFDGGVQGEFDFYTTDMSRSWIVGRGNAKLVELKKSLCDAQQLMIASAKPGMPMNQLFKIGFDSVQKRHPFYERGHLGHSISLGPQTAEAPYISPSESRTLEVGMVLAIEVPCYIHQVGGFNIEDMVLITENGAENLTYRTPHYI